MKRKIIYFIISCLFAILSTISISAENISSTFKERESNIVLIVNDIEGDVEYTTLNINKIEPEKKLVEERENFYSFDENTSIEKTIKAEDVFPIKARRVNLVFNNSILLRYKARVLRL